MTADGTDDALIKLEGVPSGETFEWSDEDKGSESEAEAVVTAEPEPDDEAPLREDLVRSEDIGDGEDDLDDDEPESDEEDAPPAPRTAPVGFCIAPLSTMPSQAMLEPKAPEQQQLVGRSILYNWAGVGWCAGVVHSVNCDRRKTMQVETNDGKKEKALINFFVYYAIDSNLSAHVLTLEMYGGVNAGCWVLLEAEGGVAEADPVEG